MRAEEQHPVGPDPAGTKQLSGESAGFDHSDSSRAATSHRLWAALGWVVGCITLFAFFLRISLSSAVNSDGANNALQAWDLLHGHVLLHGWLIGDATYYTFELPVLALSELLFGLRDLASHVASALAYGIVAVCAVALAMTNSRGPARLARCGIVIAVLAAPLLVPSDAWIALGAPDHIRTSAFLLASFLLIDRVPSARYTAPLLCVILCAGQLGDAIVGYIVVPAIVGVCAYRVLAARKVRTADTVIGLAAIVSIPLETVVRTAMRHFGAYLMVAPQIHLASPRQWPHNAALTVHAIRELFGAIVAPNAPLGVAGTIFGTGCLLAALAGLVSVIVTWRSASRAEQFLCVAIVANIAAYEITTMPRLFNPYEMGAVLPCGAVLAARAAVLAGRAVAPARIAGLRRARIAPAAAGVAALLPLAAAASTAPAAEPGSTLIPWLKAHHLSYGLANYWNGSAITEEAGNKIALRTVAVHGRQAMTYDWETNTFWFNPSRNDASFVVVQRGDPTLTAGQVIHAFGKPVSVHHVANWEILVYRANLLKRVKQAPLPPTQ
jgi:hypothetical protein